MGVVGHPMKRRSPEDAPGVVRSHRQRIESPERGKLRVHVPSREIDVGRRRVVQVFRRLGPVREEKRVAASDRPLPPEGHARHGRIGFGAVVRPHGRRAVFVAHHRPERVVAPRPDARKAKARAVGFTPVGRALVGGRFRLGRCVRDLHPERNPQGIGGITKLLSLFGSRLLPSFFIGLAVGLAHPERQNGLGGPPRSPEPRRKTRSIVHHVFFESCAQMRGRKVFDGGAKVGAVSGGCKEFVFEKVPQGRGHPSVVHRVDEFRSESAERPRVPGLVGREDHVVARNDEVPRKTPVGETHRKVVES